MLESGAPVNVYPYGGVICNPVTRIILTFFPFEACDSGYGENNVQGKRAPAIPTKNGTSSRLLRQR